MKLSYWLSAPEAVVVGSGTPTLTVRWAEGLDEAAAARTGLGPGARMRSRHSTHGAAIWKNEWMRDVGISSSRRIGIAQRRIPGIPPRRPEGTGAIRRMPGVNSFV